MPKKWSEIDSISTATDTHEFVVIQGGFSKRISKQNFLQELVAKNTAQDDIVSGLSSSVSANTNNISILTPKVAQNEADIAEHDTAISGLGSVGVVNITGVTLLKGKIIRFNSVSGGVPAPVLALADTFENSASVGMIITDILDTEEGRVARDIVVKNLDTSSFSVGERLYLSDTVLGGVTNVAPDIATFIGFVIVSDVAIGQIFVTPDAHLELPTIYGSLAGGSVATTLTANQFYDLGNFNASVDDDNVLMPLNAVAGLIGAPKNGKHRFNLNFGISFDAVGNAEEAVTIRLRANDGSQTVDIPNVIGRNSGFFGVSLTPLATLIAGKDYHVQFRSDTATLTNVSTTLATFDLTSVHIR